CARVQVEFDVW
nr:immunoglobulin heavy chain junction region [Macaca mulatta]MOW18832.1 immunoglobulin heavy chain junction region [Macaca mulatta]MOW18938.1 immunoglobulin heavy chain junction region [Macaca mulatta]MOW19001.1 immunoglobulin heavy chain junction region [Macaca mulatta]MOW19032.1 immunoglobulin heavy chain junction region [Macaca mulatta]